MTNAIQTQTQSRVQTFDIAQARGGQQTSGDRVNQATAAIQQALTPGLLNPVGRDDLNRARGALNGLNGVERSQVFNRLSDDQIRSWMGEARGLRDGLTTAERTELHTTLADTLSPTQLSRVAGNMRYVGDAEAFGTLIGRNRDGATVGQFAKIMMETRAGQSAGNFSTTEDVVARAIGALHSGASVNSALGALSQPQREALAKGTFRSGAESPAAFNALFHAVDKTNSNALQTEFFGYAAQQSRSLREQLGGIPFSSQDFPALTPYYTAMKNFVTNNSSGDRDSPRAMVDLMASRGRGMTDMVSFLEIGVIRGDTAFIGNLGEQVRRGIPVPGGTQAQQNAQTDFQRFNHNYNPSNDDYRNATVSGYFTGAAMAAAVNVNADAGKRRDLAVSLVTGGAGAASPLAPVAGQVAVGVGGIVLPQVVNAIANGADGNRQDFFNAMGEAGMPRDSRGNLPRGEARAQYNAAMSEVFNNNAMR